MKYINIYKDTRTKKVYTDRLQRFLDEGWSTEAPNTSKKQSPSKPKRVSANVTKTPKMSIKSVTADVIKSSIEDEAFADDIDQIMGKPKGE
jgi:hypothetical protein